MRAPMRFLAVLIGFILVVFSFCGCGDSVKLLLSIVEPTDASVRSDLGVDADVPIIPVHSFPMFEFYNGIETVNDILEKAFLYEEEVQTEEARACSSLYITYQTVPSYATVTKSREIDVFHYVKQDHTYTECGCYEIYPVFHVFCDQPDFPFLQSTCESIPENVEIDCITVVAYYGMWILYETDCGDFVFYSRGEFAVGQDNTMMEGFVSYLLPLDAFLDLAPSVEQAFQNHFEGDAEIVSGYYDLFSELPASQWKLEQ